MNYIILINSIWPARGKRKRGKVSNYNNDMYRKPGLAPGRDGSDRTMVKDPFACSGTGIFEATLRSFPKYTHAYVAESSAKHGAMSLDVQSPPTIFILKYIYMCYLDVMFC